MTKPVGGVAIPAGHSEAEVLDRDASGDCGASKLPIQPMVAQITLKDDESQPVTPGLVLRRASVEQTIRTKCWSRCGAKPDAAMLSIRLR
jgi:hypothetical protein